MIRRSPSLFVTFAAAFFALLLVAALLQWWFFSDLIDPLMITWERNKVEMATAQIGEELEARLHEMEDEEIVALLQSSGAAVEGLLIVFVRENGEPLGNHPVNPRMLRMLERRDGPHGPGDGPPPWASGRDFLKVPGREEERRELFSRYDVRVDGEWVGQVVAVLPPGLILSATSRGNPRLLLLFLPLALLLAGLAGLAVFRLLTRRLMALELQADRVSRGDLEARVGDLGRDEIGRLAVRLDGMTASLAAAKAAVAEGDSQRRRLLADISHDLATPLTSIRGYTETLLNPDVPLSGDERERYLGHVGEESLRMELLIDDLLELSRLESGTIPLQIERLDLSGLCLNTVDRFRERFAAAGLRLAAAGAGEECWIEADGRRMEQIVENLLSNALRYVPEGGEITAAVTGAGSGRALLTVSDDGPGFAAADLPHVFERFYRADSARTGEGSGLGLAIVREIVIRHGGEIRAANRAGGGAQITVDLPACAD